MKDIGSVCLTMKQGGVIEIGDDIVLQVLARPGRRIGKSVRIRISAPRDIRIQRRPEDVGEVVTGEAGWSLASDQDARASG